MVKLKFTNLNAELDADPKEIAFILRELNVVSQATNVIPMPQKPSTITDSHASPDSSIDDLFQKLPGKTTLVQTIESLGKPFSFNLVEQQMKIFGRVIRSRDSKKHQSLYSKFYDLHAEAMKAIVEKYGGKWRTDGEVINKHRTTRYTWIEDKEEKSNSQAILPSESIEMERTEGESAINQD